MTTFQITVTFNADDQDDAEAEFDAVLRAVSPQTVAALTIIPDDDEYLVAQWTENKPLTIALPNDDKCGVVE